VLETKINNTFLILAVGDITEMDTDVIVNPANSMLILGGGVAGTIKRKGGPQIQAECIKIGKIKVGEAAITTGGTLKAKYVVHSVGPRVGEGQENEKLHNATINSLKLADSKGLSSIAFPAISTGIFGFPIDKCSHIMLRTTIDYLKGKTKLEKVVFCLYGTDSYVAFAKQLKKELEIESGGVK